MRCRKGASWEPRVEFHQMLSSRSFRTDTYDFVEDRTHDGRKYRMLNVIDEFTHECLAIRINRKLKAIDVIDVLSDLFILRGCPATSVPTMARSLSPKPCRIGLRPWEPRPPTSRQAARGRTALSKVLMHACVTNCSTARSFTRCGQLRSSSKAGAVTTTLSAPMPRSATDHLHQRSSCRHYPRGRLRADRLRRPRWRYRQL